MLGHTVFLHLGHLVAPDERIPRILLHWTYSLKERRQQCWLCPVDIPSSAGWTEISQAKATMIVTGTKPAAPSDESTADDL